MSEELPAGWRRVPVREACQLINGRAFKPTDWTSSGLPIVRIQNLNDPSKPFNYFTGEVDDRHLINTGELLFAWSGTPGTSFGAHIWNGERAVLNQHIFRVIPESTVVTKEFLRHAINDRLDELIGVAHGGAGLAHVTKPVLEATELKLPIDLNEQRRIVAKLDALRARSRRAKEALDEVPALLDRLRQSILASAFRGDLTADWRAANPDVEPASALLARIRVERRKRWEETELAKLTAKGKPPKDAKWKSKYVEPEPVDESELPELPEGWCWASAEQITVADIIYGIIQPGEEVPDGVPYVRGMDIQDGVILVHQLRRTSALIAERYERSRLAGGDVLLGIIRATKVAVVPEELSGGNITQGTARFRPSGSIATAYLAGWLEGPVAQAWLHAHYRGIDMPGLNLSDVRQLPVPICPAREQTAVCEQVVAHQTRLTKLVSAAETSLNAMPSLDSAILAAAFRGELL